MKSAACCLALFLMLLPALAPAQVVSPGKSDQKSESGARTGVPEADAVSDLHGNPDTAKLVIFSSGYYFFVMKDLVAAFEAKNPDLRGKIFYETLPAGVLAKQLSMGTLTVGNLTIAAKPDVFQASEYVVQALVDKGDLAGPAVTFFRDRLAILVASGNPQRIGSLKDLARPGIRLSLPNPASDGITREVRRAFQKAGPDVVSEIYDRKVNGGEALVTDIHNRQTPSLIMKSRIDAGVVWASVARYHEMAGNRLEAIPIPDAQNVEGAQAACPVKMAPHPGTAKAWMNFILSPEAEGIYRKYGLEPSVRFSAQR